MAAPTAAKAVKMMQAVVAPRHTVHLGDPIEAFGPGAIVLLSQDDHRRLAEAGFLAVANAPALPNGVGPAYDVVDGVQSVQADAG